MGYIQSPKQIKKLSDDIVKELICIAFSDISNVVDWDEEGVVLISKANIPVKDRKSIQTISHNPKDGKVTVNMHNKFAALKMLMQYIGMLTDFNTSIGCLREKYGIDLQQDKAGEWYVRPASKYYRNLDLDHISGNDDDS